MKIRLLLSYKGTQFYGWQKQLKYRSVQAELESSLYRLFNKKMAVIGSGRTDTGVHALGQTAHFEIPEDKIKNKNLKKALNALLPADIAVLDLWKAPDDFHARSSAQKKSYLYLIWTGESPPVLFSDLVWWSKESLNLDKLRQISKVFLGKWDFSSFQNSGSEIKNKLRQIYHSQWYQLSPSLFAYKIKGSGFLKQMVRNIVGTSIDLLSYPQAPAQLKKILEAKDRKKALRTAPGQGLYLQKVFYPSALDKACQPL